MQGTIEELDEDGSQPVLIGYYGEYWEPDVVDWAGRALKASLAGTKNRNGKGESLAIYDMKGIYVLFKEYVPVYVCRADKKSLGSRLKKHRKSPRTGKRWDSFSWFEIKDLSSVTHSRFGDGKLQDDKSSVIATLEALLIMVSAPRLNSRRERFKGATQLYQLAKIPDGDDVEQVLDSQNGERFQDISKRLDAIEKLLKKS